MAGVASTLEQKMRNWHEWSQVPVSCRVAKVESGLFYWARSEWRNWREEGYRACGLPTMRNGASAHTSQATQLGPADWVLRTGNQQSCSQRRVLVPGVKCCLLWCDRDQSPPVLTTRMRPARLQQALLVQGRNHREESIIGSKTDNNKFCLSRSFCLGGEVKIQHSDSDW